MNSVQQDAYFRQRVVQCVKHHGVCEAARLHHVSRKSVWRWVKRYDGTVSSLTERSSRPHHHPRKHIPQEDSLVLRIARKNKKMGLDMLYIHLVQNHGYTRSRGTLFRVLRRLGVYPAAKPKPKRRLPKPYERMECCGQRVQMDVKYVPKECLVGALTGQKLYQYSAIDEYSRMEFKMIFDELSGYNSVQFLKQMIRFFPFPITCIQTDNGSEFTNHFHSVKPSALDIALEHYGIRHKLIRVATPRHNGKVERSHRTDQHFFYDDHRFFSLADANKQLHTHLRWTNNRPRLCHNWRSALSVLRDFLAVAA
jgi:transposase InsO family protein